MIEIGDRVRTREGDEVGTVRGNTERCSLEGCHGTRIFVRWPDGHFTKPCSEGLRQVRAHEYQII